MKYYNDEPMPSTNPLQTYRNTDEGVRAEVHFRDSLLTPTFITYLIDEGKEPGDEPMVVRTQANYGEKAFDQCCRYGLEFCGDYTPVGNPSVLGPYLRGVG